MPKIDIVCPHCATRYTAHEEDIGATGECEKCGKDFVIARYDGGSSPVSQPAHAGTPAMADEKTSAAVTRPAPPEVMQDPGQTMPAVPPLNAGATMMAGGQVDQAELKQAEQPADFEWKPGDVILDLYEVRKVTEGFGEDAKEKDFHEGGFGRVYKVWHRTWHLEMAVKTPKAGVFKTQEHKDAFTRECETWIKLGLHPHIAACHYVRNLGGAPRVFSEYAEAGTLEDWISSKRLYEGDKQAALARVLDVAIQFAWGLHAAHEKGVVHQDVKPLNALMWNNGILKVTDFGLAGARQVTGVGAALAPGREVMSLQVGRGCDYSPEFCSPEQAAGRDLTRRTDVWSWAVSVLEMFTGEVTWRWQKGMPPTGPLAARILEALLERNGKEEGIPAMPAGVAALLRRCFRQSLDDRPHDLHECAAALCEVYQTETGEAYTRKEPKAVELLADSLNNRGLSMLDLAIGQSQTEVQRLHQEAERLWDEALKAEPSHPAATYNRGLLLWRSGRMTDDLLVMQLRETCEGNPGNSQAFNCLGQIHIERGDMESAVKILEDGARMTGGCEFQEPLTLAKKYLSQTVRCIREDSPDLISLCTVYLSSDGRRLLKCQVGVGGVHMTDMTGAEEGKYFSCPGRANILSVHLIADGRLVLGSCDDAKLRLWDAQTRACLRTFEGHTKEVMHVSISSDERWALSGSWDKTLRLWDVASGQCVRTFEGHSKEVNCVCLSRDGAWAMSGSSDYTLRLWETKSGRCLRIFEGHTAEVAALCLSTDGLRVLSGAVDKTLRMWDVATGRCIRIFHGHQAHVNHAFFTEDNRWALSSGRNDKTLRLWDVNTGRCLRTLTAKQMIRSAWLTPNGRWAVSGEQGSRVSVWDISLLTSDSGAALAAQAVLCRVTNADTGITVQTQFRDLLAAAKDAASAGRYADALCHVRAARELPGHQRAQEALHLLRVVGRNCMRKSLPDVWCSKQLLGHTAAVKSACFSVDGRIVLSCSDDKTVRVWDLSTAQCLWTLQGHEREVNAVAMSRSGNWALSGSGGCGYRQTEEGSLRVWDLETGKCVRTLQGHTQAVTSVGISADDRLAVSGSLDGSIRLWDVGTGRCLNILQGHRDQVLAVSMTPDGRRILSGGGNMERGRSQDHMVRLWDAVSGRCVLGCPDHKMTVLTVFLSADGKYGLSGDVRNVMMLWDLVNRCCIGKCEGHDLGVTSACLSPDGRWALSGSFDKTVRLWEVSTGRCVRTLEGHHGYVMAVCFSGDGDRALSGSWDGTLRLWELDWEFSPK